MVTFLIIIGRVPAIIRFRGIFFSQKVIFIDLLKIKSLAIANPDFDENYIFDRFRSRRIFHTCHWHSSSFSRTTYLLLVYGRLEIRDQHTSTVVLVVVDVAI